MITHKKIRATFTIDEKIFNEFKKIINENGQKFSTIINILLSNFIHDVETKQIQLFKVNKKEGGIII